MKTNFIKQVLGIFIPILMILALSSNMMSDNGKAGATGSPSESNCTNCHGDFSLNSGGGSVTISSTNLTGWQYTPGVTYHMTVTVAKSGNPLFGVGVECLTSGNQNAGTLIITDAASTQIKTATISGVSRRNVVHQLNGGLSSGSKSFNFDWTAPTAGTGTVTFYFAGLAGNNDGNEGGDYVYTGSRTVTEASTVSTLSLSTTSTNVSCFGGNDGSSTATVSGGVTPYTYSWSPSGGSSATANNLSVGTYIVTVTDGVGSTKTATTTITQPTQLIASSTANSVSCGQTSTTVTVSALGGTAPYVGTGTFNHGLGSYSYTVTDSKGCSSTTTGTISQASTIIANAYFGNISCNGGTTTLTITATGGVPPYSGTGTFIRSAGPFCYFVTDASGCTTNIIDTIYEPNTLTANATSTPVTPIGANNGTATVTPNGGTAPYSITWNTIPIQTGLTAIGLSEGNYDVTIIDANGCSTTTTVTVNNNGCNLTAVVSSDQYICESMEVYIGVSPAAVGGTAPYTYNWSVNGTSVSTSEIFNVIPLDTTEYVLTITDVNGCIATNSTTVYVGGSSTVSVDPNENGELASSIIGATYQWFYNGDKINGGISQTYSPTMSGDYSVIVYNAFGCISESNIYRWYSNNEIISIYPNPASTDFRFNYNTDKIINLKLYDIIGNLIISQRVINGNNVVNVSSLQAGVYYMIIEDNDIIYTNRITIKTFN